MTLHAEHIGPALVLHLEGRLTAESDTDWMRDAMNAVTGCGARHALLDMGSVGQIDCEGIGQLLRLRERVHGARRTFGLFDVERRQRRMLELSGLNHVFRVFGDRQAAISALGIAPVRPPTNACEPAVRGPFADRWGIAAGLMRMGCGL
jgi:anti-anti-sigma factor